MKNNQEFLLDTGSNKVFICFDAKTPEMYSKVWYMYQQWCMTNGVNKN